MILSKARQTRASTAGVTDQLQPSGSRLVAPSARARLMMWAFAFGLLPARPYAEIALRRNATLGIGKLPSDIATPLRAQRRRCSAVSQFEGAAAFSVTRGPSPALRTGVLPVCTASSVGVA